MITIVITIVCGIFVGLALGLTGGGGSIFAVPLLIYGLGLGPQSAVATSLAVVALVAAIGAIEAGSRGLIELRAGLIFAAAGVVTAPLGVALGDMVPGELITGVFALLMLAVAARMIFKARISADESRVVRARPAPDAGDDAGTVCRYSGDGRLRLNAPCSAALVGVGLLVGVLAGLFGVGGGFLIVPALIAITAMGIHRAVATSLLVIALVSLAGLASAALGGREIDWPITALFVAGGLAGLFAGRSVARDLAGPTLQLGFAGAMVAVAAFMFVEGMIP